MKELLNKEITNYLEVEKITHLLTKDSRNPLLGHQNNKMPSKGNLDWLMEDFIDKLQESFGSTVYTVLKTSEKMIAKADKTTLARCVICRGFTDEIKNALEVENY